MSTDVTSDQLFISLDATVSLGALCKAAGISLPPGRDPAEPIEIESVDVDPGEAASALAEIGMGGDDHEEEQEMPAGVLLDFVASSLRGDHFTAAALAPRLFTCGNLTVVETAIARRA
ncbi:MAG TPA: hypothetical protein VF628_11255 [Allosphingosinicella sp.]|jgi:hypothetical protein